MVYFGLAEDDTYDDEPEPEPYAEPETQLEDRYRERPNVRRLSARRRLPRTFSDLAREARVTRDTARLVTASERLYRWRLDLTGEAGSLTEPAEAGSVPPPPASSSL